jgi:hypothetical protein
MAGSGATTLTGIVKGNGTSAFTAAVPGTDYAAPGITNTWSALQTFGLNISIGGVTPTGVTGSQSIVFSSGGSLSQPIITAPFYKSTLSAINSTATATASQVGTGCITSTSASAVTITLPTMTSLVSHFGAIQGGSFPFFVDNTAGASTVTIALGTGMTLLNSGSLTIPAGASGVGKFEIYVSSTTAGTLQRVY